MTRSASLAHGLTCPAPLVSHDRVLLGHGSGGKLSAALIRDVFMPRLTNSALARLEDAALLDVTSGRLAMSTDTFVVQPLEFPGGNIGSLAVHGTLNDVAMMGARPAYLSVGFVLEEGLPFDLLERLVDAMSGAASDANVPIVAADTKVVERGKADGVFINTTGVGELDGALAPSPARVRAGDAVLVSGPIGRHGIAILAARGDLSLSVEIESDSANLSPLVEALRHEGLGDAVHALRDPTRGGMASALNEIAAIANAGIVLDEGRLPIPEPVAGACELLGFDPLYVANEGILVAIVAPGMADRAVTALRRHPLGACAAQIGRVVDRHPGLVAVETAIGGTRVVDMLPGDQLPRIC